MDMINDNFWNHMEDVSFSLCQPVRKRYPAGKRLRRRFITNYHLVQIQEGRGILYINETKYEAVPGSLFLLHPKSLVEAVVDGELPLQFMMQSFTYKWKNAVGTEIFAEEGLLVLNDAATIMRGFEQLYEPGSASTPLLPWKRQLVFQEMLFTIVADQQSDKGQGGTRYAIEKAKDYMETYYHEEISLSTLAQRYGISASNFAGIFKKHIGVRPIEYLTRLRMEHAKTWLRSQQNLKTVASKVGFRDELYFSRTFKKVVGVSPTIYMKNHVNSKIMTVFPLLNDYLLALDLKPFATLSYAGNDQIRGLLPHIADELMETKIVGRWDRPDRESVLRADPELILGVNWASLSTDAYRNVAPTITLFNKDNWRDTLLELATLFGKKELYTAWLKQYDQKAADARSRLGSGFGQEKTVMLLVDAGKEWRVYGGKRQLGDILYKELKLTPPIGVKPQSHYTVISESDLARMNPDHIFLTTCNSNSDAQLTKQLKSSPVWNALRAVQNDRLREVPSWFNSHAPIQHSLAIDMAVNSLLSS